MRHPSPSFAARPLSALLAVGLLLIVCPSWSHDDIREPSESDLRNELRDAERARERDVRDLEDAARESSGSNESGSSDGSDSDRSGDDSGSSSGRSGSSDDHRAARDHTRFDVERDTQGHERVPAEVLLIGSAEALDAIRHAGFGIVQERPLAAFAETLARVRVRRGETVERALRSLRDIAPEASIAPHHVFRASASAAQAATSAGAVTTHDTQPLAVDVGIIDTGIDGAWPALREAVVRTQAFAGERCVARAHGTIVAEILARSGARLSAADVFGVDANNHLVAPAAAIASAIDWLVANNMRVINISIEGPDNVVLAHVIRRAIAQNVAIVAAAGNGGPSAAAAFPAAYPGVIAVTAVDERGTVYRRANRGDYIAFAARGVRIETSYTGSANRIVSGTSFAAPVVAARIAPRMATQPRVADVLNGLEREARDLGAPGKDEVFGWGELDLPNWHNAGVTR